MMNFRAPRVLAPLALITLVVIIFSPVFWAEFVDYDDPALILENGYVNTGFTSDGVRWAFTQEDLGRDLMHQGVSNLWHPLTWISHMADMQMFGAGNPSAHHIHNLLLHLCSVLLVYALLLKLKSSTLTAFTVSCLFAFHPMHVESVAWISERKDVLSGAFFFASLYAYLGNKQGFSVILFSLALLSKPSVVVLPGILLLLDWWRTGFSTRFPKRNQLRFMIHEVVKKLPWLIPAIIVAALTVYFQYTGSHRDFITPLKTRITLMPANLGFSLWRTIWPIDLSFHYPHPHKQLFILGAAGMIMLLGIFIWRLRTRHPALLFGALWFLCLWLPVSGIFQVGSSFTADRYSYLAHVGFFLGIVKIGQPLRILSLSLLPIFAFLSFQQTRVWRNSETLFTHAVKAQPRDAVSIHNLGSFYQVQQKHVKAIELFTHALKLNSSDHLTHFNLGNSYRGVGNLQKAQESFQRALKIRPAHVSSHLNLGLLLADPSLGNLPAAEKSLVTACQLSQYRDPHAVAGLIQFYRDHRQNAKIQEILLKTPPQIREKAGKILGLEFHRNAQARS